MEQKREKKEKDTLLEMGNMNSDNDLANSSHMKRMQGESNKLTEDGTPDETDDNENTSAIGTDIGYDDSSGSSSEEDEQSHILDPNSCKGKIATVMKSNVMQYSVIAMVIIDCLIIVLELLIDMEFIVFPDDKPHLPDQTNEASNHVAYVSSNTTSQHGGHELSHNHNTSYHNSTHDANSSHVAHTAHHSSKEQAEHILHALSLTILSLFMIEVSLKIYVEGKHLLRQKAEVFDAVVVIVSFTLDIVFSFVSIESAAKDAAGLMVLLRLWRVTRIINGVILSVKIEAKKKTDALKKVIRQLEHDNRKQRSKLDRLEKENSCLRQQLTEQDGSKGRTNALVPNKVSYGRHLHEHMNNSHSGSPGHNRVHKDSHEHGKGNNRESHEHDKKKPKELHQHAKSNNKDSLEHAKSNNNDLHAH